MGARRHGMPCPYTRNEQSVTLDGTTRGSCRATRIPTDHKSCLDELDVEAYRDIISNENSARFERRIPYQAEILAIDLRYSGKADAGISPRVPGRFGKAFHGKNNAAVDSMNRQVAGDLQFTAPVARDASRLERELRELLDVEEVGALQMRVALGLARVQRGGVDGRLDGRPGHIGLIQ